jgi:hypothetical protein
MGISPHPDANAEDFETSIRKDPQPPGSNDELVIKYFTEFYRGRKKWMVPETYYCSYFLPPSFVLRLSSTLSPFSIPDIRLH